MLKKYKTILLLSSVVTGLSLQPIRLVASEQDDDFHHRYKEVLAIVKRAAASSRASHPDHHDDKTTNYGLPPLVPGRTCLDLTTVGEPKVAHNPSKGLSLRKPSSVGPNQWWKDFVQSKQEITSYVAGLALSQPKAATWFLLTGGKNGFAQRLATPIERNNLGIAIDLVALSYTSDNAKKDIQENKKVLFSAQEADSSSSDNETIASPLVFSLNLSKWSGVQTDIRQSPFATIIAHRIGLEAIEIAKKVRFDFDNPLNMYLKMKQYHADIKRITEEARVEMMRANTSYYVHGLVPAGGPVFDPSIFHLESIIKTQCFKEKTVQKMNDSIVNSYRLHNTISYRMVEEKVYTNIFFEMMIQEHKNKLAKIELAKIESEEKKRKDRKVSPVSSSVSSSDSTGPLSSLEETTSSKQPSEDSRDEQSAS